MKLLIVLSLIAYGYAAKLDRTYLPPASAGSAGGSPGSLIAPGQDSNFGQQTPGFRGSQSQSGRGPFNQQGGAQPSGPFGQDQGFQQPGSNDQAGLTQPSGFGRPSGQPGFGQAGANQPSSFGQPSGTGVQPAGLGVQPSSFRQPQFGQSGPRNQGAFGQSQQPERAQASADRNAEILRYNSQNDGETFSYDFETSNGISAEESGVATNGVQAQGGYSYTGDDGQFYRITYTADENGYLPQGDHLPTPPPIPEDILKSIEENARAAAAGTQEGAYNPDEDDSPQQPYQGQQQPSRGSNNFGPSGPAGQPQRPQGPQGSQQFNQPQRFNQGAGPAFNSQGQQGFPQGRPQGQNGGQGSDQSGYDYSRPQNQGRQPSGNTGNANFIPSGPSKGPGPQNTRRPFQQNQPAQTDSFGSPRPTQGQYQAPEYNQPQRQSENQGSGSTGSQYNQGSQNYNQRTQQSGNQKSGSQYNQNQGHAPSGPQNQGFVPNRPQNNQQQGFPGSQGSQGQRGQQASQGQRGQSNGASENQDGYDYSRPQSSFNSGNQGQFRPQSQGPTGTQGGFPGPQGQPGFRGTPGSNRPGTQGPSQGAFPGSGANRPGSQSQQFPGAQTPQFPGPRGQSPQGQQPQRPGSQQPYNPLANQTFNQKQETFGGPRQPPSFSSEEGYKY